MAAKPEARVAPWKRREVDDLTKVLKDTPVIALARIDKLPSRQFQDIRASVRDHATIRVTKNTLLELALQNLEGDRDGLEDLEDHLTGQNALILTDQNPFKLFKLIESSKAKAPAKAGDLAPHDIKVEKGDTPFKPGPVVGDLQKAGLPAKIESGKVVIAKTSVVAEQGTEISADLANALTRLEIHPMTVGLDLKAVWEDGSVFDREVLDIDEDAFLNDMKAAHARAFALAVEVGIPTPQTLPLTIAKAVREARGLALETAFPAKGVVDALLARGQSHALSVAGELPEEASPDAGRETPSSAPAEAPDAPEATEAEEDAGEEAEDEENDEENDEEVSDEEAAAGPGSLE